MDEKKIYSLGSLDICYIIIDDTVSLTVLPRGFGDKISMQRAARRNISDTFHPADSLVQIALAGDGYMRNFSSGFTQSYSDTTLALKFSGQDVIDTEDGKKIITHLRTDGGISAVHHLIYKSGTDAVAVYTEVTNGTGAPIELENISSGRISNIPAYSEKSDYEKLIMHRFGTYWSQEGKLISEPLTHFGFDENWLRLGNKVESFGSIGTMPTRRFMPFIAIEDKSEGIVIAAKFEAPLSWQIDTENTSELVSISGGQANFIHGHWSKKLADSETFTTFKAFFTAVSGSLLDACNNLTEYFERSVSYSPKDENLPLIYNEYCYTWGHPNAKTLTPLIKECAAIGVECFVMDAGWFKGDGWTTIGDWEVDLEAWPNGLSGYTDEVHKNGMLAGIWFEFESVSANSKVFKNHPDWMLTYKGSPIKRADRYFFDFRRKEVTEYLKERVIKLLKENSFDYLKVDYNENIGLGADGEESFGENLRAHTLAVVEFFKLVRKEMPNLIIEMCASGGMRHDPLFLTLGSMCGFSDAHECPEGLPIAMSLHRYMPARHMQIWATMNPEYDEGYSCYTLAKAMLGRMCLSGNIAKLSKSIQRMVYRSADFYKTLTPLIKNGRTLRIDCNDGSVYSDLNGKYTLVRESADGGCRAYYFFSAKNRMADFVCDMPEGFEIVDSFGQGIASLIDGSLRVTLGDFDFSAAIVLCKRG